MADTNHECSATSGDASGRSVYELRIYHLHEGKQELIVKRFQEEERPLLERHGIIPLAFWIPTDSPGAGRTFIYLIRHDTKDIAELNWRAFQADPEWIALKSHSEANGPFVERYEITFLEPTQFSPLR